ncbi:MAG TPA: hypothetical protein DCG57_05535, partial [Candidatus Riflebacteria bacterium]|nr:hypothetical protein [Candidatus Riflebacteria bacterium]
NDRWGIVLRAGGNNLFQVHSCIDGVTNLCAQIAGWNFNANQLYSSSCGLILSAAGSIQTGDFVTSNKGWKIDSIGNAEFNNLCARGAIKTVVFIKDQISVVGGCAMIRPAGLSAYDVNPTTNMFNVFVNSEVSQFAVNDLARLKDGLNDYWGCVIACGCNQYGCYITLGIKSGARFNFTKGQAIVNYGSAAGCGGIVLNGQCPYIDLYTHSGAPWNGTNSRVRIGNLNGWGAFATDTYGIAAGCPIGQYLTFDSASGVLNIKGVIVIQSGSSGIAGFSDANIDNIADGATYKRTTINEKAGAGYGFSGLVSNGTIVGINRPDTRGSNELPTWYTKGSFNEFKCSSAIGITGANSYGNLVTEKPWCDASGGYVVQTYTDGAGIWQRRSCANHLNWQPWYKVTDGSGGLVNRVVPAQNAAPSGAGLYLGADYMGYYNGGWKTYMDNTGNFYLSGTSGGLAWVSNVLTVCGIVCACSGCVGGFTINDTEGLYSGSDATRVQIKAGAGFWAGATAQASAPFSVTQAGVLKAASGAVGGWEISSSGIRKYGETTAQYIWLSSSGCPTIVVAGYASTGASYHTFGGCLFNGAWLNDRWGIVLRAGGNNLFQVHSCIDGVTNLCAQIAGWNFNSACLYSGALILNSAGSIAGNYTAGSAGWCISSTGAAEFNNVTVRGTTCATSGRIGNICISASCLWPGVGAMTIVSDYFCSTGNVHVGYTGINTCRILLCFGQIQAYNCNASGSLACNTLRYSAGSTDYAMCICMFGGSTCYAFCSNGRINVNSVSCSSDRNMKTDFQLVSVLPMIRQTPITKWRFKDSHDYQIGWMAQDFHCTFRLAHNWETNLTVSGLDGIALRGVQELDECVAYNNRRIIELESRNACLETRLNCLETEFLQLKKAA